MGEVVTLRRARKAKTRAANEARAIVNRVAFGRTKAERANDDAKRQRAELALDRAKRED